MTGGLRTTVQLHSVGYVQALHVDQVTMYTAHKLQSCTDWQRNAIYNICYVTAAKMLQEQTCQSLVKLNCT